MSRRRVIPGAIFCTIAVAAATAALAADSPAAKPKIGDKLALCQFTDIRFLPRTLSDFVDQRNPVPKRAFVLVFTNTTCPIVLRYLPRLKQLSDEFRDQGVQFVAIDVGPGDSILDIATQALEHDMPFPFVNDIDGSCVAACGVDYTAAAVLVDADYKIRYRGRIDNSFRFGGTAPGAVRSELRDAIRALLAGKEIAVTETPVDGCAITAAPVAKDGADISYAHQIAPILERNCTMCHREGTSAPFALTDYDDVASNAAMIAQVVDQRRMPPWYASPGIGKFINDRTMPAADRRLLVAWANAGAPTTATRPLPTRPPTLRNRPPPTRATFGPASNGKWASPIMSSKRRSPTTSPPTATSTTSTRSCPPSSYTTPTCKPSKSSPATRASSITRTSATCRSAAGACTPG